MLRLGFHIHFQFYSARLRFISPRTMHLAMNGTSTMRKDGIELVPAGEETSFSSLRPSGTARVRTQSGLVRLASDAGRIGSELDWEPVSFEERRRPDWRRLHERATDVKGVA